MVNFCRKIVFKLPQNPWSLSRDRKKTKLNRISAKIASFFNISYWNFHSKETRFWPKLLKNGRNVWKTRPEPVSAFSNGFKPMFSVEFLSSWFLALFGHFFIWKLKYENIIFRSYYYICNFIKGVIFGKMGASIEINSLKHD